MIGFAAALWLYAMALLAPGPAKIFILAAASVGGRAIAFAAAMGIVAGSVSWSLLSALTFAILPDLLPLAVPALRLLGAIYLLWLALAALRAAKSPRAETPLPQIAAKGQGAAFRGGFLFNLANPNVALFWISLFSLYASGGMAGNLALSAICGLFAIAGYALYAWLFSTGRVRRGSRRAARPIAYVLAALLALLAFGILADLWTNPPRLG